jgi:hypothetical protein
MDSTALRVDAGGAACEVECEDRLERRERA